MLPARTLAIVCLSASLVVAQTPRLPESALRWPPTVADPKPPPSPEPKPAKPPEGLVVATDAKWKAIADPPEGWEKPEFDDSKWVAVEVMNGPNANGQHYTLGNQFGVPTTASWVWLGDQPKFAIRRTFEVPVAVRRAELLLIADDEADVSVNGEAVGVYRSSNPAWGHRGGGAVFDLTPYLIPGKTNCISAKVRDLGIGKGFAAEVRVNSAPLLPRLLIAKPKPPAKEVLAEVDALVKKFDDPVYATREAATRKLVDLTRTHGQSLYDKLNEVMGGATLEAGSRIERALEILDYERDIVFAREGTDGRLYYPAVTVADVGVWWKSTPEQNPLAMRYLVQAKLVRDADTKEFNATARKRVAEADDTGAATVVGYISSLELADLADVLVEVMEKRPKTTAAALAASGLGRMGKDRLLPAEVKALTAASKCGHEPTERAASVALAALGK